MANWAIGIWIGKFMFLKSTKRNPKKHRKLLERKLIKVFMTGASSFLFFLYINVEDNEKLLKFPFFIWIFNNSKKMTP